MRSFFRFFAERHLGAYLFTLMVLLLGAGTLLRIQRDIFPDVDLGEVIITTRYPGASPRDVELAVTNKIEEEVLGVANIDEVVSWSMEGMSIVRVTVDVDAEDNEEIKDEIRQAVNRVGDLPPEVEDRPLTTEIGRGEIPVIEVGITGEAPYRVLRRVAQSLKDRIEAVPGVSNVDDVWYLDREVWVKIRPEAIDEYQVPLSEVAAAISRRNVRATGGTVESYEQERSIVTEARFTEPEDVRNVVVRATFTGPVVRVGDVAEVDDTFEKPTILARIEGQPAITFLVEKKTTADIIRTVDAVRQVVEEARDDLPPGVELTYSDDQSYYVRNRFNVVLNNGGIGLGLVLIILTVFLTARIAFWVGLSIPVVLLGVVFLLPPLGFYLDIISLTAMLIVIGIIVDDGIIVSENIVRHREMGDEPVEAAAGGITDVAKPVMTTLLTTFLAFAPMFFMPGVVGTFVEVIPAVISLALLVSLFETVIALPAHLVPGLKKIEPGKSGARTWFAPVRDRYEGVISKVIRGRWIFLLVSVLLFAGSLWYAFTQMQFILFPASAANTFFIYVETSPSASLERTADLMETIEDVIARLPEEELESFATRVGSYGQRQPGERSNWGFIRVNLTPYANRNRTADVIVDSIRQITDTLPGFEDIIYEVEAGGPPVGAPVTIRVVGSDTEVRRALTDSVVALLRSMGGVSDIDRNDILGEQQVALSIDYERLSRLGLTVADVAQTVRIAYDGQIVTSVQYGDDDVEYRVLLTEEARGDTAYLRTLRVPNAQGRLIELGEVATLEGGQGPSVVYHYEGEQATMITADVDEDSITAVQATERVTEEFDLGKDYPDMRFVIGGEAEETQESFESLYIAFGVAVIAIYFLLMLLFNSVTQPLAVVVAIPFGIIAVIIAFALHGEALGFLALMGLVGLSGVVVNDSLVMVSHINKLRDNNVDGELIATVAHGASDRLRPVTMTTLTTVAGLIPLAYGLGGSDPFIAPMALALGYGLLFATPLTLALVPCLYVIHRDVWRWGGKLRKKLRKRKGDKESKEDQGPRANV